jgi:uncharacterized SAM-binding protein YcdF (DUF218 family)
MDASKILADTKSETSYESVRAVSALLREHHGRTCIAVSDGFHLYRVKVIFAHEGITVFTSPDPDSPIENDPVQQVLHTCREMLSSSLWYLGYHG